MHDYMIGLLLEFISACSQDDVVTIGHVMKSTHNTISKHSLMPDTVSVCEKRVSALLVVEYHPFTYYRLVHCPVDLVEQPSHLQRPDKRYLSGRKELIQLFLHDSTC